MSTERHHAHECPICERHFGCLKEACEYLYYRICGECREKHVEVRRK